MNKKEKQLLSVLKPCVIALRERGLAGDEMSFQTFVDIDEKWRELYGFSLVENIEENE